MTGVFAVARLIRTIVALVVAVIVLAIVLRLLDANPHNDVVRAIHDAGNWLVTPFRNLFSVHSPKGRMALNWGIAAVVYAIVGGLIARVIAGGAAGTGLGQGRASGWRGRTV